MLSGDRVFCEEPEADHQFRLFEKVSSQQAIELRNAGNVLVPPLDCFLVAGSEILDGVGKYIVLAVGKNCTLFDDPGESLLLALTLLIHLSYRENNEETCRSGIFDAHFRCSVLHRHSCRGYSPANLVTINLATVWIH